MTNKNKYMETIIKDDKLIRQVKENLRFSDYGQVTSIFNTQSIYDVLKQVEEIHKNKFKLTLLASSSPLDKKEYLIIGFNKRKKVLVVFIEGKRELRRNYLLLEVLKFCDFHLHFKKSMV